jgi:UrcA family protein
MFTCKCYLLAAVASALPIAVLHAATEMPIVRVTYQDLDLATPAGVAALCKRIQQGAARYCEPVREITGTRVWTEFDRCVKDAITTTVKKIDRTGLTAFHTSHGGRSAS